MRRSLRVTGALMLAAAMLLVAACGGDDDGDGGGDGGGENRNITVVVSANAFWYEPAELGIDLGVWEKRGLNVKNITVTGGGEAARPLAAGQADLAVNFGMGSLTPIEEGLEAKLVAGITLAHDFMGVIVPEDSPIKNRADLQGKRIGITSPGSLTDFLAGQLGDVETVPIGGLDELIAALEQGTLDAFIWSIDAGFVLQAQNEGRLLMTFEKLVPDNISQGVLATDELISERPDVLQDYLDGWFETQRYMVENRAETVDFSVEQLGIPEEAASETYDASIGAFTEDGSVPPRNLENLTETAMEAGMISEAMPVDAFWDGNFVPADPSRTGQ